jgi:hypothetical protein
LPTYFLQPLQDHGKETQDSMIFLHLPSLDLCKGVFDKREMRQPAKFRESSVDFTLAAGHCALFSRKAMISASR